MVTKYIKLTKRNAAAATSEIIIDARTVGAVTKSSLGTFVLIQGKWTLVVEERDEVLAKLGWEVRV